MPTRILLGVLLAVLGAAPGAARAQTPGSSPDVPRITPDEVLVLGRPSAPGRPGLSPASPPLVLTERARGRGLAVAETRPLFANRNAGGAFPGGAWLIRLEPGSDPEAAAARLAGDPAIAYAGPNHVWQLVGDEGAPVRSVPALGGSLAVIPDDSLFAEQYGHVQSKVPEAWERSLGHGIVIGVVDTGIDADHPDLVAQIAVNAAEANGLPGVDDDGNGYVDDVRGYDFTDAQGMPGTGDYLGRDPDPDDEYGHGTGVAGVAAAAFNNGIGVAGVAPGARILPLRAGFTSRILGFTFLTEDDIAAAILYAVDQGADIINMSFGSEVEAPVMTHALEYARSRGVLLVAAAGNTGRDGPYYPASLPGVVAVGASAQDGGRTGFSTYGQDLDFLAAGAALHSTWLQGTYRSASGTSFSAPFTCGVAALVWSAHPTWTADQVAWQLRLTAQDAAGGWTPGRGWGILDANAAVSGDGPPPVVQPEAVIPREDGSLNMVGTVAYPDVSSWTLSVVSESAAIAAGTVLPAEAMRLAEGTGQVVAESLAAFTPPPGATDRWVLSLKADVPGRPPVAKRSRFRAPAPQLQVEDLRIELVVGDGGWDILAHWASPDPYQGAVRAGGKEVVELAVADHHAVRVVGPLDPGPGPVQVLGRAGDRSAFTVLADSVVAVPPREQRGEAAVEGGLPPGTPMPRTVDWDGDGLPEVLLESPPTADTYGTVQWFELAAPDDPVLLGSSDGTFRGIPFDAADADGDGGPELLVFRVDGWTVWEAPAPGAFPDQPVTLPAEATGIPIGFVDTGSGIRLLVADARVLKAFRLDPGTGFVMTGQDSTDRPMGRPSAGGDFDADGRLEVALAGESGGIVIFEVTDQAVTAETGLDASNPMLALRSRAVAGGPDELFSMELEPYFLRFEGDFIRRLSRLRRWRHDGQALVTVSTVSFAGFDFGGDVDLHDLSGDLVLRRRERFDVVAVDADAVGWGETLATSSIPVTGSVLATFPSGVPWIWAGTSAATMDPGEGITVVPGSTHRGGPLQVEAAASVPGGVRVELVWNDLCASESLLRSGPVRGTYAPPSGAGMAVDTLALGETVTFTLTTPTCSVRTLQLTGRTAPLPLSFAWADSRTLVVDLPRPLPGSPGSPVPPGEVALHDVPGTHPVRSVQVLNGGTRLWIAIPEETPADTLLIGGTWYADGYPLGGRATRVAHALPPRPDPVADPVLAAVRYGPAGGWHLEVTLGGGPFTCPGGFVLEPPGTPVPTWEPAPAGAEYTLRIPLAAPLRPGTYTLRFGDPCLGERISPLGTEVIFRAGPLVYPNPIPPEGDLVVENMEPGSRVHVLDLRGEERASFTVEGAAHRRPVTDLAPGLYILRIEDPEGRLVSVQKIVIRR